MLVEFKKRIEHLYKKDNLDNHFKVGNKRIPSGGDNRFYEPHPDLNWCIISVQGIRGNKNKLGIPKLDFYTLLSNNNKIIAKSIGKFKDICKEDIQNKFKRTFYYAFNNDIILLKFINYLKTNFARTCLLFHKTGLALIGGELKYIPWFDFSESIFNGSPEEIDIALFNKYNISQEIVDHIVDILPNYYNLDLSMYKNIKG